MLYHISYTSKEKQRLPVMINLIAENHLQEPVTRGKNFMLYQLIYCIDGQGEFVVNGQRIILMPGQIMLTYPFEIHSYKALTEEWHVHIVGFSGSSCDKMLEAFRMKESGVYHFSNDDIFHTYFSQMKKAKAIYEKKDDNRSYTIALSKICYELLLDLSMSIKYIGGKEAASNNAVIQSIIAYMEEHYMEQISLDQIAEHVNLCRSYMSELFKKETQQTMVQYLNTLRVSQAYLILREQPELRVAEVGKMCGFENASYFGETFKKIAGVTPLEYRLGKI